MALIYFPQIIVSDLIEVESHLIRHHSTPAHKSAHGSLDGTRATFYRNPVPQKPLLGIKNRSDVRTRTQEWHELVSCVFWSLSVSDNLLIRADLHTHENSADRRQFRLESTMSVASCTCPRRVGRDRWSGCCVFAVACAARCLHPNVSFSGAKPRHVLESHNWGGRDAPP